jgi:Restriction endonuclease
VGLELRQASSDAFTQFSSILANAVSANDGSVCREGPIAEAFPNAFLGVLMPEAELLAAPKLKRGRRFDWLTTQFPGFLTFKAKSKTVEEGDHAQPTAAATIETPLESLEAAYSKIRGELKAELLDRLKAEAPAVFERIVIELLDKMGYGGSRADAAQAIGKAGDEGLDGLIKEDRLGLDIIYVQAKRWAATVGRPEIQKFAGALHGQHATKGIFITTSDFSRDANDYVSKIGSKIVLIDGSRLAELMVEFGVAVTTDATYTVKRIDNDFLNQYSSVRRVSSTLLFILALWAFLMIR